MIQQVHIEHAQFCCCPRCGSNEVSTMAELGDLVSTPSYEFASDLAEWLSPPEMPERPTSRRRRNALRNSVAFGVVWMTVLWVACFALTLSMPSAPFVVLSTAIAITVGTLNWRSESKKAQSMDSRQLEPHLERYRSYLHRRRVWSRLRYCFKCAMVVDPATQQTASLFEVHELAHSRQKVVSLH
jgi:hypothetical protein